MPLAPATRLGPYEILAPIGAGGMGEVYRARDSRLARDVAVKILPPHLASDSDMLARFEREARVVAALSHPNIVVLFDLGNEGGLHFAVMELLQGETLREMLKQGPCDAATVAQIGSAIADALSAAHDKAIIHRDLKPENVFITNDRRVKVLDFGLAQLGEVDANEHATKLAQTAPGMIMGTLAYMSPEQVRGESVQQASDIFSLGCVLYEMMTGRSAFSKPSATETIAAILRDAPPNLVVSRELDRIVSRCLAKTANDRFPSASAVSAVLRGVRQVAGRNNTRRDILERGKANKKAPPLDSIAVLPFVNAAADDESEYLSDGITESLINTLSEIPMLRVIPRSTTFRFRGVDVERAARELNARLLVTGRILQRNDNVDVQAELVDPLTGSQLWGRKFKRELSELAGVDEEIARDLVGALRLRLNSGQKTRLKRRPTGSSEAYQLYLKGRYLWNKRTREGLERGVEFFKQAIEEDSTYALAYAGLADCYAVLGTFAFREPAQTFPRARAAAQHALEIDPELAEAHVTLGVVGSFFDLDFEAAEREFRKAIALRPNYAVAHQWYGMRLCLSGNFERGLLELEEARRLDPLSPMINAQLGVGLFLTRRYEDASRVLLNTVEFERGFWPAHYFLAILASRRGDYGHALTAMETAAALSERHPATVSGLGQIFAETAHPERSRELLQELCTRSRTEYVDPFYVALVKLSLDDQNSALELLEQCLSGRSTYVAWFEVDPRLDALRGTSRFDRMARAVFQTEAVTGAESEHDTSRAHR